MYIPLKKPRSSAHASSRQASFTPSATTRKLAERSPYAVASGPMSDTAAPTERRLSKYRAPVASAAAAAAHRSRRLAAIAVPGVSDRS